MVLPTVPPPPPKSLRLKLIASGYTSANACSLLSALVRPGDSKTVWSGFCFWRHGGSLDWVDLGAGRGAEGWVDLCGLYLFGLRVPAEAFEGCLSPELLEGLREAGLLPDAEGGCYEAEFQIFPHSLHPSKSDPSNFVYFLTDLPRPDADAVMPIGYDTLEMLSFIASSSPGTAAAAAMSALDVCCGSGALGVWYKFLRGSGDVAVTSVDVNARCLEVTRYNGALNGARTEAVEGSAKDEGIYEGKELVISNPPFVALPASARSVGYAKAGWEGMDVVDAIVSDAGAADLWMVTELPNPRTIDLKARAGALGVGYVVGWVEADVEGIEDYVEGRRGEYPEVEDEDWEEVKGGGEREEVVERALCLVRAGVVLEGKSEGMPGDGESGWTDGDETDLFLEEAGEKWIREFFFS